MAKTASKKSKSKRKAGAKRPKQKATAAQKEEIQRVRTAKGRRPYFFDDPNVDRLIAIVMALTGEVSVLRERLDTHERLAADKQWADTAAVEKFDFDDDAEEERARWRSDYIARVLRIITDELEHLKRHEGEQDYKKIIAEVSRKS